MKEFQIVEFSALPNAKGVYAFFLNNVRCLPPLFHSIDASAPIYIGRTRSSFTSRDLKTHLGTGKSGASTLRKTLIAILDFPAIPRSFTPKPRDCVQYRTTDEHEVQLTDWMKQNLLIGILPCRDPDKVELEVLRIYNPPLNLKDIAPCAITREIKRLRRAKAEEALKLIGR